MTHRKKSDGLVQNIDRMLNEGKYAEALQLVRGPEKPHLDNADKLKLEVLESKCLMNRIVRTHRELCSNTCQFANGREH